MLASRVCYTMLMADWTKLLQALGFSGSESAVYLASLELGPSPVQGIAKKAGVSRVTTYAVIQKLSDEGLMSSVTKGKKQFYTAESPDRLLSTTRSRIDQMQTSLAEFKSSLNELRLLQGGEKPVVKFFEGIEGIRATIDELLTGKTDVGYEIANRDEILASIPESVLKHFRAELDRRKIHLKGIYLSKPFTPRKLSNVKIVSTKDYSFHGGVIAFGNKLVMTSFKGKVIGIVVDSKELANTFAQIFKMAWRGIK
jgi:sugar-specific transcriptional regulator TrmB